MLRSSSTVMIFLLKIYRIPEWYLAFALVWSISFCSHRYRYLLSHIGSLVGDLSNAKEVLKSRSMVQTPETNITTNLLTLFYVNKSNITIQEIHARQGDLKFSCKSLYMWLPTFVNCSVIIKISFLDHKFWIWKIL